MMGVFFGGDAAMRCSTFGALKRCMFDCLMGVGVYDFT